MKRLFIGLDMREPVAWHVAVHSALRRTREPISFAPIGNSCLPEELWWRKRGPYDSTDFSNARFLVPYLCNYQGWAAFVDCDVLFTTDIASLFACANDNFAVMVRKQRYNPRESTKFLGQKQTQYSRKNWSSLMLFNCGHPDCRNLDLAYVNKAAGLDLHGFAWCAPSAIGDLPETWNYLVKHGVERAPEQIPDMVHYTEGGPWHGYTAQPFATMWEHECAALLSGDNPRAKALRSSGPGKVQILVTYQQEQR